jgi:membrane associated rhomboid family serine protease
MMLSQLTLRTEIGCLKLKLLKNNPSPRTLRIGALRRSLHLKTCAFLESERPKASEQPPHHTENLPEMPGSSPARLLSDSLIIANVVIFVLQLAIPEVTFFGIKSNELIDQGQIWRFITPAFLHGSPTHLLVNMLSLHSLGPITEWTCGRQRFLAIYLLSAVAGNFASFLGDDLPSLGASGAIFGLSGALSVYFWRNRQLFGSRFNNLQFRLLLIIVLNLGTGFVLPQIDEFGHLGGLLGGVLTAFILGPRYELCRVKGESGVWLIDDPPVEALATPPRKMLD